MRLLQFTVELVDLPLAGHGYDVGGSGGGGSGGGGDDGGGLSLIWIIALASLALVTVGVLVWLNPSGRRRNFRSLAPKALIAVIIAAPLVAWTVSSQGGADELMAERWIGVNGMPELLVSLGDDKLNTLDTTNGKKMVRVVCVGDEGQVVIDGEQKWPFVDEAGFDYPHAHQAASRDQLQQAESCRLRGTRVQLEADVEGSLTP
jgi:hypothetical protein